LINSLLLYSLITYDKYTEAPIIEETPSIDTSGMIAAKDHPDYAPFFKMAQVGVPRVVVEGKMGSLGLNGSFLDDPERLIPAP